MQDFYMNLVKEKLKKYVYAKDFIDHATSSGRGVKVQEGKQDGSKLWSFSFFWWWI